MNQTFNSSMTDSTVSCDNLANCDCDYTPACGNTDMNPAHKSVLERCANTFKRVNNRSIEYTKNTVVYNTVKSSNSDIMAESKRRSHNYDSHQMCFFIYLLAKTGYEITIQRTYKKSNKTDQVVRIKSVCKDGKQVFSDVEFDAEDYECNGDLKMRRRTIDNATNNKLLSLLEQEDAHFSTKKCKELRRSSSTAVEGKRRLKWIEYGCYRYEKNEIDKIGKRLYDHLAYNIRKHDYTFNKRLLMLVSFDSNQPLVAPSK